MCWCDCVCLDGSLITNGCATASAKLVAKGAPLLLYQHCKATNGAAVRVQHHLRQCRQLSRSIPTVTVGAVQPAVRKQKTMMTSWRWLHGQGTCSAPTQTDHQPAGARHGHRHSREPTPACGQTYKLALLATLAPRAGRCSIAIAIAVCIGAPEPFWLRLFHKAGNLAHLQSLCKVQSLRESNGRVLQLHTGTPAAGLGAVLDVMVAPCRGGGSRGCILAGSFD